MVGHGAIDTVSSAEGIAEVGADGTPPTDPSGGPETASSNANDPEFSTSSGTAGNEQPVAASEDTPGTRPLLMQWLLQPVVLALAALLLSVLGVVAAALTSVPDDRGGVRAVTGRLAGPLTQHQLPEMIADLKPTGRKPHFLQVVAVVELPKDAVPVLQQQEAAIVAEVQLRLRDRDRPALVGNRGAEQLREEMISIMDARIAPHRVSDVLFTRFLVD